MSSRRWSVVSRRWEEIGRRSAFSVRRMLVALLVSLPASGICNAQTTDDSPRMRGGAPQSLEHAPSLNPQLSTLNPSAIDRQLGVQNQIRWQYGLPPTLPDYPQELVPRPWTFSRLIPPQYFYPARQPTGHRITATGPNGYTYEPTYDVDLPPAATPPQVTERELLGTAVDAFRAGRYAETLHQLERLESIRPRHGPAGLLRTQADLALGDYGAAAASLRRSIDLLPAEQWGLIVENFTDYYPDPARLAEHLQRLGEHAGQRPDDADARLLLGYEYGFLGHRELAATELTRAAELAPRDEFIATLLAQFGNTPPPAPTPTQSPAAGWEF